MLTRVLHLASISREELLYVYLKRCGAQTHLDEGSPAEEEAKQVGHDVITDDDGNRGDEPGGEEFSQYQEPFGELEHLISPGVDVRLYLYVLYYCTMTTPTTSALARFKAVETIKTLYLLKTNGLLATTFYYVLLLSRRVPNF